MLQYIANYVIKQLPYVISPLQIPKICLQFESSTFLLHLSHRGGIDLTPPRDFLRVSVNAPPKQRAPLASGKRSQAR